MPEHSSVPDGYGTVTPWIISKDSAGLIRFLEEALDAEEIVQVMRYVRQSLVDALRV